MELWCPIKFGLEDHKSGLALGDMIGQATRKRKRNAYAIRVTQRDGWKKEVGVGVPLPRFMK